MDTNLIILTIIVGILTLLQGWQMVVARRTRKNSNPSIFFTKLDAIIAGLGEINTKLDLMTQRLEDVWGKVNKD